MNTAPSLNLDFEEAPAAPTQPDDGMVEVTWPVISIDEVEGYPQFETVTVNGTVHQIRRSTEVCVGPAVVSVLKNCVGRRYVKVEDPNGRVKTVPQEFSTIPWRQIGTRTVKVFPEEQAQGHQIYFGKRILE